MEVHQACIISGYQYFVGHQGMTMTSDVFSLKILELDLSIKLKGGKAWKFSCPHDRSKPSTASDCGSGLHETCFSSCLFICDAKKSISGKILNFVISFIKKDIENYHSTLSLRCLDIKLTLMFLQPGMTSAEILTFCVVQKFPNMFW